MTDKRKPVLSVQGLTVEFPAGPAVQDLSLNVYPGELVALVGESGCGKSQTALSIMGLQSETAKITAESMLFQGNSLLHLTEEQKNELRGKELSMIFQEPMTALNPVMKVGRQIAEAAIVHGCPKAEAKSRALAMMEEVGLPDVRRLYEEYPHRLSGGMRQRATIAMALLNRPALLIADEPTTALDVTTQAQILELLQKLNRELQTAVLLISHDLEVIHRLCSRVFIMYAGRVVESGPVQAVLSNPGHPYTQGLLSSIPSLAKRGERLRPIPGVVPNLEERSKDGCPFFSRCERRRPQCETGLPANAGHDGHLILCWNSETGGEHGAGN